MPKDLKDFIIFFTVSNLALSVTNWGLRDYSIKLFVGEERSQVVFSKLFSLRIALFILTSSIVCFIPIPINLIFFILIFSCLKFGNNTIEAFSTSNNKNAIFAGLDLLSFAILLIYYCLNFSFELLPVLLLMTVFEALKFIAGSILFRGFISFKLINPLPFLKETYNYFLVAFFAFLLSKTDFYISSLYLNTNEIINYHVYSSLIGLSQVVIASFFSRQMVNWFKLKEQFSENNKHFLLTAFALSALALPFFYFITLYLYKFNLSVTLLVLVFFNLFIYSITLFSIYLKTHQNRSKELLSGILVSAIVNIILSFILIDHFGMIGAIISNIAGLLSLYLFFKIKK